MGLVDNNGVSRTCRIVPHGAAEELMDWLWPGKGSAIELMDVNDPKFALRIFADPTIEGRIAMGIAGTVRNGPIEWLIHCKQIWIAPHHHFTIHPDHPLPRDSTT